MLRSLLIVSLGLVLVLDGRSLAGQPVELPTARWAHAMTYDPGARRILLFGGKSVDGVTHADLWSWDGARWSRLDHGTGPSPRDGAILAHDVKRGRTVLFGGRDRDTGLADTWEWDGRRWERVDSGGPGNRVHAAGEYDAGRGAVVVFGGVSDQGPFRTDTWAWDGDRWRRVDAVGWTGRVPNGAGYDPASGNVISVGVFLDSAVAGGFKAEVRAWTGSEWQTRRPDPPPVEPIQSITITGTPGQLLLFDGRGAIGGGGTTWLLTEGRWVRQTGLSPPARAAYAMAFDAARRRVVLFGGGDQSTRLNDTWEWDGTRWIER